MARVNPGEFLRQVRAESAKIVWPTRKETGISVMMVLGLVIIAATFFVVIDMVINALVRTLIGI